MMRSRNKIQNNQNVYIFLKKVKSKLIWEPVVCSAQLKLELHLGSSSSSSSVRQGQALSASGSTPLRAATPLGEKNEMESSEFTV